MSIHTLTHRSDSCLAIACSKLAHSWYGFVLQDNHVSFPMKQRFKLYSLSAQATNRQYVRYRLLSSFTGLLMWGMLELSLLTPCQMCTYFFSNGTAWNFEKGIVESVESQGANAYMCKFPCSVIFWENSKKWAKMTFLAVVVSEHLDFQKVALLFYNLSIVFSILL